MPVSKSEANAVFSRYAPFIRDYIYSQGWTELRDVQLEAAKIVFDSDDDLLITSATASGKTEAAFFPVLSLMESEGANDFLVLYIAPLKSLINDQFSRMELLCDGAGIPVCRWHGDVPAAPKKRFLKDPAGILQITPESLESMLLNRPNDIPRIFANLKFVILDEIHTLPGRDRGEQTRSIVERISRLIGRAPRRIGLSATVGDTDAYAAWLCSGGARKCRVVDIPQDRLKWRLYLEHFYSDSARAETDADGNGDAPASYAADAAADFIYRSVKNKKSIVFSNSREETEHVTATLRQIASKRGEPDVFYIHHGNLSAAIREEAETALKDDAKPSVACATVTLELGIDIGRLERVVNVESPNTVTGFLQRIGRSGRRGNPCEMLMIFREEKPISQAPIYQLSPWQLIQGIAVVQLYLEERWVEPPLLKTLPVSLLFHQVLAAVGSSGSLPVPRLAGKVLNLRCFAGVEPAQLTQLISHMVKNSFLSLDDKNELTVGEKGEKLLSDYHFYAVFKDSEDFMVREGSEEIGTVSAVPPVGDRFALAGRVWEVQEFDVTRRLVYVKRVEGKMEIAWPGDYGEIHTKIMRRMKRVLSEDTVYPYLGPNAAKRLSDARDLAAKTGILDKPVIALGKNSFVMFPWLGTRAVRTLKRFLMHRCSQGLRLSSVENTNSYYLTFKLADGGAEDVRKEMKRQIALKKVDPHELVGINEFPVKEKFDPDVPQELLREAFCRDCLDVGQLIDFVASL
ncbi:MAG: DEAD/DEAH box helicase [Clostridia bacterium]|nr:DEAD/DEAH box helicase [Clostridia bacterium]